MIPSDLLALFMIYSIWLLKLEVVSSTLPVDLRREEIAIRQLGKINSYKNTIPIKRKLEVWKEIESRTFVGIFAIPFISLMIPSDLLALFMIYSIWLLKFNCSSRIKPSILGFLLYFN
jgi:hypothetical protein